MECGKIETFHPIHVITTRVLFLTLVKIKKETNMNTSKLIGLILIILSLGLGYTGTNKIADNSAEINVLGLEIDASNESGKQQGYLYLGLAAVLFMGGIYTFSKSKS